MKKNFLPAYKPPILVEGSFRWYIKFYAICDLQKKRRLFKHTYNLNRIKDLETRRKRGYEIIKKLDWWLSNDNPISKFREHLVTDDYLNRIKEEELSKERCPLGQTNVIEALDYILKIKMIETAPDTARSYKSVIKHFKELLKARNWDNLAIMRINRVHACAYMDSCIIERELGNWAYNNNLRYLRITFNDLESKGYIEKDSNPFYSIKYKPKTEKIRRPFTLGEAKIVIERIKSTNTLLFYALLFEYCCFIRPSEIWKLKGEDVFMREGIIVVPSSKSKNKKTRYVAIPDDFLPYFDINFFESIPANCYIFGKGWIPGQLEQCSKNRMGKQHRKILLKLKKEGKLKDITGLQWYSWKDTGITYALESGVGLVHVQEQARHSKPEMTLRYRHGGKINYQFKKQFTNKVID